MNTISPAGLPSALDTYARLSAAPPAADAAKLARAGEQEERAAFDQFVGEAFYGQLLGAMRKTVGKAAYFNGGRAEEMFQGQLDQTLSQDLARNNAGGLTEGMYQLFRLTRS
ncbi:MAG: rod-binding protein [Pirellulales bacterium]|nr:rod-binding protein [Pirellulales bacterium]